MAGTAGIAEAIAEEAFCDPSFELVMVPWFVQGSTTSQAVFLQESAPLQASGPWKQVLQMCRKRQVSPRLHWPL